MPADAWATLGARASAGLVLTPQSWNMISNVRRIKITATSPRGQWIINLYCNIPTICENLIYKTHWGRSKLCEILDTFEYTFLGKSLNIE